MTRTLLSLALAVVVFAVSLSLPPTVSYSQENTTDRLATAEARLEELEQTVADLEERVAALEGATTSTPSEQSRPTPAAEAIAPGESSRDRPVPMGTAAKVGDWSIAVISVTPDAWAAIQAENQFNDPPQSGHQYFMVTISMTYQGAESAHPSFDPSFNAVGESNVGYDTFSPGCGVLPQALSDAGEVFMGGTIEGNVCFAVKSEDIDSLVMYVGPLFSMGDARMWFSLNENAGIATG